MLHSTLAETRYFLGTRNPILEHHDALRRIENDKYFEAELISAVAPNAFARTELVGQRWRKPPEMSARSYLAKVEREMHERYPNGFVLKPISSFSTDGKFPSDRTAFVKLWTSFKNAAARRVAELEAQGVDPTDIHLKLKNRPTYPGRILNALLTDPDSVMIQERLDIAVWDGVLEEYRVHVVGGRVLAEHPTSVGQLPRGAARRIRESKRSFNRSWTSCPRRTTC